MLTWAGAGRGRGEGGARAGITYKECRKNCKRLIPIAKADAIVDKHVFVNVVCKRHCGEMWPLGNFKLGIETIRITP